MNTATQNILTGTKIEAHNLSDSSFYKKVKATIVGFHNGYYKISAYEVISKWSDSWEKHPSSCSMSITESQISKVLN